MILNIVHIKRDFNCDDALFELFCTSDVFHKSLLIVHCYKIVCIYFKLWSEIFFYTFLYLLKNYWFTYFRKRWFVETFFASIKYIRHLFFLISLIVLDFFGIFRYINTNIYMCSISIYSICLQFNSELSLFKPYVQWRVKSDWNRIFVTLQNSENRCTAIVCWGHLH